MLRRHFIAAFAPLSSALAQQDDVLFRAGTAQVRVDAQVASNGRAVAGLGREDFALLDDGKPVAVQHCAQDEEPVSVLLLLDVSGSMKRHAAQLSKVAQQALAQLHAGDRAGVMLFSKDTLLALPLSDQLAATAEGIGRAVEEQRLPSGTAINAGLVDAAAAMGLDRAGATRVGRYAIVILTDNSSLNYRVPDEQVLRGLSAADAVLNAIVVGKERGRRRRESGNPDFTYPDVYKLAEESGGEAVGVENAAQALPEMMRSIRQRYSLSYALPEGAAPGSYRRISVSLGGEARRRHGRVTIRARAGYYVPQA